MRENVHDDVLDRVERALSLRLDRSSVVYGESGATEGFRSSNGTWVRIERRRWDRYAAVWVGLEAASTIVGVRRPSWLPGAEEMTSTDEKAARLVVEGALSARTIRALEGSRAEETVRKYDTAWRQFVIWCAAHRLKSLPASEETVMEYIAERGEAGWVRSTLDLDLAAVRYYHRANGERVPDTAGVRQVIRYYSKQKAKAGYKPSKAAPAVPESLIKMVDTCDLETSKGLRDRCLMVLGEFMLGRRSEIVCLDIH
ncbi:MAG: site-specific integrase [Sciscionella sp.]